MNFFEFQKDLRDRLMPSGGKLAKLAQRKVTVEHSKLTKSFNFCLKQLLDTEYQIYRDFEKKCSGKIIELAVKKGLLVDTGNLAQSFRRNYNEFWDFFLSISQSRKTRAGGSFERHVRYLFELLKYPFDRQKILNGKVDYVIPSQEAFTKNRTACVVVSVKRTLRERWRQVVGELASTNAGRIYILTADEEISNQKVEEMKKHNVNLIVWDKIKQKHFSNNFHVLGFTQFVKEDLPSSKKLWKRLLNQ